MLPLYGPSTFRDVPRIPVGMYTNVLHYVDLPDPVSIPLDVLNLAEDRSRADVSIGASRAPERIQGRADW